MRDDDCGKLPTDPKPNSAAKDVDALRRDTAKLMGVASACNAVVLFVRAAGQAKCVECGAENAVTVTFDNTRDAAEFTAVMRSLIPPAEQPESTN